MIRLFSNTYNQTIVLLLLFTVGIRFFGIMVPYANYTPTIDINYLASAFKEINQTPLLSFIISTVIVFISALILNTICIKHEIVFMPSYLPAYFFILLNSLFVDQFYAGPALFVNLFIILSLGEILKLYQSQNPTASIFIASLLAGISALLNISYLMFFVFVIIGINVFRPFTFKDNLAAFIGFIMPLYMGTMVNFLVNDTFLPFKLFYPDYGKLHLEYWAVKSAIPMTIVVCVFAVMRMYQNFFRNTTKAKRTIQMLLILMLISIALILTGKQNAKQEFSFIALPLSIYYSYYFSNYKFSLLKEIVNIMLLAAIIFFQYKVMWGL